MAKGVITGDRLHSSILGLATARPELWLQLAPRGRENGEAMGVWSGVIVLARGPMASSEGNWPRVLSVSEDMGHYTDPAGPEKRERRASFFLSGSFNHSCSSRPETGLARCTSGQPCCRANLGVGIIGVRERCWYDESGVMQ